MSVALFTGLFTDAEGRKTLGVHIVGEAAAELSHIGQVAMLAGWEVDAFVENIFATFTQRL